MGNVLRNRSSLGECHLIQPGKFGAKMVCPQTGSHCMAPNSQTSTVLQKDVWIAELASLHMKVDKLTQWRYTQTHTQPHAEA